MSNKDSYFETIGLQLIQTPTSSQEALNAAAKGMISPMLPEIERAVAAARSWVNVILREEYQPSNEVPFLGFTLESGVCDVVRTRYSVNGYSIEIAQSVHMISIKISRVNKELSESDEQIAENLARQLFAQQDRIKFRMVGKLRVGKLGTGTYGKQAVLPTDPRIADWLDKMRWWRCYDQVGFITLKKASGEPPMGLITPDERYNRDWFSLYKE